MVARIAADAVMLLHLGFIAFATLGGWLLLRHPRLAWLHLPALAWGTWIELSHGICPLTPLENHLRQLAGDGGYQGSFIDHYLIPLIYPAGLAPDDQLCLATGLIAINIIAYAAATRRFRTKGHH